MNEEEWLFLIKSSLSVYWHYDNKWIKTVDPKRLTNICLSLLNDKDVRIIEESIRALGNTKNKALTPPLIKIIESTKTVSSVKEAAIYQFAFNIIDERIIIVLKDIVKNGRNHKLRKSAVYAFGMTLSKLAESDKKIIDNEIGVVFSALSDSMTQVRKQAADVLSYMVLSEKAVDPLIAQLKKETSISSRKAIVSALGSLMKKEKSAELITPILKRISSDNEEDYRVREEAKLGLQINQ